LDVNFEIFGIVFTWIPGEDVPRELLEKRELNE
jgi:hypothetical protein